MRTQKDNAKLMTTNHGTETHATEATNHRVLIICDSLPGALTSCAQMLDCLQRELQSRGHTVDVAGIGSEPHVRGTPHSVFFDRLKSERLVVRAMAEAWSAVRLSLKLVLAIKRKSLAQPTLVVLYVPSIFLAMPAVLIKKLFNAPMFLIQRDIVPDWLIASGRLRPGFATRVLFAIKNFTLHHATTIGVECAENMQFIPAKYQSKSIVLDNWRNFDEDHERMATRQPHHSPCFFIYGGRIGVAQGFDRFLSAFVAAKGDAQLRVHCDDRGLDALNAMPFTSENQARIDVRPMLAEADFLEAAAAASYGLVCLAPEMKTHNIPGKLLAYLAAGIPVFAVGVAGSALQRVVEELNCGVFAAADSPSAIVETIQLVTGDKALQKTHQQAAIAARDRFRVETAADTILATTQKNRTA